MSSSDGVRPPERARGGGVDALPDKRSIDADATSAVVVMLDAVLVDPGAAAAAKNLTEVSRK